MPIYHGFYSGFHARHQWNSEKTGIIYKVREEHGESWVALFIDLVYVAMFMNIGYILEFCGHTVEVVAYSFVLFFVMFNSRFAIDTYSNRFFVDDLFHRLVYCIYTYGVFIMTLNISYTAVAIHRRSLSSSVNEANIGNCVYVEEYWDGFAYGFFITRGSLTLLYAAICYQNKGAYQQFGTLLQGFILSIAVVIISLAFAHGTQKLYIITIFVEAFVIALPTLLEACHEYGFKKIAKIPEIYPKDRMEMQSRLGVFYMMTLGESMIQLLHRVYNIHEIDNVYRYNSFSFILVFSFGMQYFDAVSRQRSSSHAMTRSSMSHILFVWTHPILAFFNIFMTVGLVMMFVSVDHGEEADSYFRRMLSLGAFAQVAIMVFMRMLHKGLRHSIKSPARVLYIIVRLGIAFSHFSMRYYTGSDTDAITYQACIAIFNNFLDIAVAMKPEALNSLHSFSSTIAGQPRQSGLSSLSTTSVTTTAAATDKAEDNKQAGDVFMNDDGIALSPINSSTNNYA